MIAVGLLVYMLIMLLIGIYTYRFMRTIDDFLLGGRKLGAFVIAFSERASGESAWFLLGLPGFAYAMGMSVFWTVIGVAIGIFVSWSVIAKRLRFETEKYGALTIPDYLEERFQDKSKIIRLTSTAIITLFYLFYLAAQIIGAGKILNATFGMDPTLGMLAGTAVIVLYTMAGGFTAVALTDLVQGIIMLITAVFLPIFAIVALGGVGEVFSKLQSMDHNFLSVLGGKAGRDLFVGTILGGMGVGLGYMGQPHLLTRYMAIKSTQEVRKGVLIAMLWVLLAYWGAPFIGIVGKAHFPNLSDPEKVMPMLSMAVFPPIVAGFVIAGAVAAMMSTADSQLLVVTSALVEDIYRKLLGKEPSQDKLVTLSRWATFAVTAVAFLLALFAKNLIYWLVLYAWSGLGASFGPPILLALLWKRTNGWGALAGMITGTLTTILWYNIPALKGTVYELIPAFLFSLLATYIFTLLTDRK